MPIKRSVLYDQESDIHYLQNQKGFTLPCKIWPVKMKPGAMGGLDFESHPCCSLCPFFDINDEKNVVITCGKTPVTITVDKTIPNVKPILAKA